jgi:MFS family permease
MTVLLATAAVGLSIAAAIRSTWSPCGVSMLSTMTPLAERARGHRYSVTTAWFVAGAVSGGACLGLLMAALAAGVHGVRPGPVLEGLVAVGGALVAAASDARLAGFGLPVHHRQVNERWLDQFRPWVYGAGFGWQIGTGLATYIKTAAVYLMILLAALTGDPVVALSVGLSFGLVRGLAVFLGSGITSSDRLAGFHRRFAEFDSTTVGGVVAMEVTVGTISAWLLSPWVALAMVVVAGLVVAKRLRSAAPPQASSAPPGCGIDIGRL